MSDTEVIDWLDKNIDRVLVSRLSRNPPKFRFKLMDIGATMNEQIAKGDWQQTWYDDLRAVAVAAQEKAGGK